jgi:beta-lactamase superfamily II metal-dependent hydrolase
MKRKIEGRRIVNITCIIAIVAVLFSCVFYNQLSILLYLKPDYKFNNDTEIHFINVGQGDAIAIKFDNGKTMLIDTGTESYRSKLTNYLDNIILNGTNKIDYLVLTHIDTDHSGNMVHILNNYEIGTFYRPKIYSLYEDSMTLNSSVWYDKIINKCNDKNITMKFNEAGVVLQEGFTELIWLSPINLNHNDIIDSNDFSPIIRLEYQGHSALLTGDASSDIEDSVINSYYKELLDIDILKVAHHGSYNSTSLEFLKATTPKYACISVGENTYGHPSNILLDRILEYDENSGERLYSNIYSTVNDGNIIFTLDHDIKIDTIRNIDDYSFVSYFWYVIIAILSLAILIIIPYIKLWIKNIKFVRQNKKFERLKQQKEESDTLP